MNSMSKVLNTMKFGGYVTSFILFLSIGSAELSAQFLMGLKPIKSTCQDVERLFGGQHCGRRHVEFKNKDERVSVTYTVDKCDQLFGKRWNLPPGTVVRIGRYFRYPVELGTLGISFEESDFERRDSDIIDHAFFHKKSGDLVLSMFEGRLVDLIEYFPSLTDEDKFVCDDRSEPNR